MDDPGNVVRSIGPGPRCHRYSRRTRPRLRQRPGRQRSVGATRYFHKRTDIRRRGRSPAGFQSLAASRRTPPDHRRPPSHRHQREPAETRLSRTDRLSHRLRDAEYRIEPSRLHRREVATFPSVARNSTQMAANRRDVLAAAGSGFRAFRRRSAPGRGFRLRLAFRLLTRAFGFLARLFGQDLGDSIDQCAEALLVALEPGDRLALSGDLLG